MIDISRLNPHQKEAVLSDDQYLRIIAGAGSGKTRVLTMRIAHLIEDEDVRPDRILAITFTNKAANEMKQRIADMIAPSFYRPWISTIHSLCVRVLREDISSLGYPKNFTIMDGDDQKSLVKEACRKLELDSDSLTPSSLVNYISNNKTAEVSVDAAMKIAGHFSDDIDRAKVYQYYMERQKQMYALDFDDLILFTVRIFRDFPSIREKWQRRFEFILVDEFQDVDRLQYRLIRYLCNDQTSLYVVGDPDQTIYTWRGARIGYLLNFDKRFDNVKTISLLTNYRSTPEILNCANSLIDKNSIRMKKDLIPVLPSGTKPVFFHASSPKKEAEWVVEQIGKLARCNVAWRDITILFRAHYLTRSVEEELIRKKIPYRLCSGAQFFDRKEIKDALCYLRMIVQQDDLSFVRIVNVPKRNIGARRMKILKEYSQEHGTSLYQSLKECLDLEVFTSTKAKEFVNLIEDFSRRMEEKSVSKTLSDILDASGYEKMLRTEGAQERLDDLAELKQSIYEWETTVGEETDMNAYLRHIALFTNAEMSDKEDRVRLMTIHAAKGLEFPYVFICGMSEGIFPSSKVRTMSGMEEERRLAFVAMTRCEKGLYLSDGDQRNASDSLFISRFVLDVDPSLVDYVSGVDEEVLQKNREYIAREADRLLPDEEDIGLQAGDRVRHRVFGEGTVEKIDPKEEAIYIRFDSLPTVRALALSAAKKLEKILRS